jgi:uncharacterized protein YjiS (DUF1127 family)
MTDVFFSLADRFSRLRARQIAPTEKRTRADATNILGELATVLRNRRVRRRWQRDLRTLDDRLLRDIGVSRTDVEQAARRLRVWI